MKGVIIFISLLLLSICAEDAFQNNFYSRPIPQDTLTEIPPQKIPGKYEDEEIIKILHQLLPRDSSAPDYFYTEPDSENTKVDYLSRGLDNVYLIQTCAGDGMTGSCGWYCVVCREIKDSLEILWTDCGWVDSVLAISHNGLYDFRMNYREFYSTVPHYFRFDGKTFLEYENPVPPSKEAMLQNTIGEFNYDDRFWDPEDTVNYSYIAIGNSEYIFVKHNYGIYLIREISSTDFRVINYFEEGYSIDVMEKKTNKENDIRVWGVVADYGYYTWNGKKYVLKAKGNIYDL